MENQSSNNLFSLKNIIIGLLLIFVILFGWMYLSNRSNYKNLVAEKEQQRVALQAELDSLLIEHERVKQEYGSLSLALSEKDSVIQANAIEIKTLLDTQWEFYRVQKKLDQLRKISQGYLKQMDSLYTVNRVLKEENIKITADFEREKSITRDLQKDKQELVEKVEMAAVLRAYGIDAKGVSFSGGRGREAETDRARRTDKIKICFTLAENAVLKPGMRDLYIRIARPDNRILVKGLGDEYSFIYKGDVLQYSAKETVNYENESMRICSEWIHRNDKDPMQTGLYVVTIFADDQEIGQTYFELK